MRHSYVGDVGDFGKYGLLRIVSKCWPECRMGVVWYLTDSEEQNNDGRHDGYLKHASSKVRESYRSCDPDLYDYLQKCRRRKRLSLSMVEKSSLLPADTVFFGQPLPIDKRTSSSIEQRWRSRKHWHAAAVEAMEVANCIFVDPDNGIVFPSDSLEDESPRDQRAPSHKHAYWDEVLSFLKRGASVIAYHHLGRQRGGHSNYIMTVLKRIHSLGYAAEAIRFRRGSARCFFLFPATSIHREPIAKAGNAYSVKWAEHCCRVTSLNPPAT